jgi:sortase A
VRRGLWSAAAALFAAAALAPQVAAGTSTRIEIPRIHLDAAVGRSLDFGPAYYPGSALPGEPYTVAIAGHRTTHTHPFWSLDELRRGDRIVLLYRGRRHLYRVTDTLIVQPTDWGVVRDRGFERLVLSTCTPRFSARERLVVIALPLRETR